MKKNSSSPGNRKAQQSVKLKEEEILAAQAVMGDVEAMLRIVDMIFGFYDGDRWKS